MLCELWGVPEGCLGAGEGTGKHHLYCIATKARAPPPMLEVQKWTRLRRYTLPYRSCSGGVTPGFELGTEEGGRHVAHDPVPRQDQRGRGTAIGERLWEQAVAQYAGNGVRLNTLPWKDLYRHSLRQYFVDVLGQDGEIRPLQVRTSWAPMDSWAERWSVRRGLCPITTGGSLVKG